MSEIHWLILAGLFSVLGLALCIRGWIIRRREGKQYMKSDEVREEIPGQVLESETEREGDTLGLEDCRKSAWKLARKLGVQEAGGKVIFYDEDRELTHGYMYALMEILVGEKNMWVVFYPNPNCDITMLVFDRNEKWDTVFKMMCLIDEVNDNKAELCGEEDDYPAYVWDSGNYDPETIKDDIARAAELDPRWEALLQIF